QPPAHLSALHPFPTRRSSDLKLTPSQTRRELRSPMPNPFQQLAVAIKHLFLKRENHARSLKLGLRIIDGEVTRRAILLSAASRTDRKSTRLNSSHEWISYAVF